MAESITLLACSTKIEQNFGVFKILKLDGDVMFLAPPPLIPSLSLEYIFLSNLKTLIAQKHFVWYKTGIF